jgi:hypothetical protein
MVHAGTIKSRAKSCVAAIPPDFLASASWKSTVSCGDQRVGPAVINDEFAAGFPEGARVAKLDFAAARVERRGAPERADDFRLWQILLQKSGEREGKLP